MAPVAWRFELLGKNVIQLLSHVNDAVRHRLDVMLPFLEQLGIVENKPYLHT